MNEKIQSNNDPVIKSFFDEPSMTFSYVVSDSQTKACAIIDSVMGFDLDTGRSNFISADKIIEYITDNSLRVEWIIETHIHADHLSAAQYLKSKLGGKIAVSEKVNQIQSIFGKVFNAGVGFAINGAQFDYLFKDDEDYSIGNLKAHAILTPGHTPACMTHIIEDAVFVGDTIFMPDVGTARADFPGGNARALYASIKKILSLPDDYRLFMCHDYPNNGREIEHHSTIRDQREYNIHVNESVSEAEFVSMREARDKTLNLPKQILQSVQVNMRAGHFPEPENNGIAYIKIPINHF